MQRGRRIHGAAFSLQDDANANSINFAISGAQTGRGAGRKVKDALLGRGVAPRAPGGPGELEVYVTDTPDKIPELSARFLGERVERAEHVDIEAG